MSRVYSVLTGAGATRPAAPATIDAADTAVWDDGEDTPFVEIGGPTGPIFSPAHTAPSAVAPPHAAIPGARPEAKHDPARPFPRLAPASALPTYVSVRFHGLVTGGTHPTGDAPDPSLVALHFPEHAVSGEYRVLRDEVCKQLPGTTTRVLHFASAASEAGTTTVLLNLAITLGHEPKTRVLVVDANVNRPAIAAKLALKRAPGLCEVLAGHVPLAWTLQPSVMPSMQVLPLGDLTDATVPALGRDLPKLVGQLRQWFEWVLIDAGVWGTLPELDAAAPSADAVYLVTRESNAERPEFTGLRDGVKERGGLLRGYVATRV